MKTNLIALNKDYVTKETLDYFMFHLEVHTTDKKAWYRYTPGDYWEYCLKKAHFDDLSKINLDVKCSYPKAQIARELAWRKHFIEESERNLIATGIVKTKFFQSDTGLMVRTLYFSDKAKDLLRRIEREDPNDITKKEYRLAFAEMHWEYLDED